MRTAAITCILAALLTAFLIALWASQFSLESSPWDALIPFAALSFTVTVVSAFALVLFGIRALFRQVTRSEGA